MVKHMDIYIYMNIYIYYIYIHIWIYIYIHIWYMGVSWESVGDIKQGGVNEDDQ